MYDPKSVILQLAKRWEASYHEVLGTEELKRHLLRMLDEAQRKELASVFSGWSGEALLAAVDCLDDLDDGHGVIAPIVDEPVKVKLVRHDDPVDTEYLPMSEPDGIITTDTHSVDGVLSPETITTTEPVKRAGRPPGAKNRAPRSDKGKPRS